MNKLNSPCTTRLTMSKVFYSQIILCQCQSHQLPSMVRSNSWLYINRWSPPGAWGLLGEDGAVKMMVLANVTFGHLMFRTHLFPLLTTGDSSSAVGPCVRLDSHDQESSERSELAVSFGAPEYVLHIFRNGWMDCRDTYAILCLYYCETDRT